MKLSLILLLVSSSAFAKLDCFDYAQLKSFHLDVNSYLNKKVQKFDTTKCKVIDESQFFSTEEIENKDFISIKDQQRKQLCTSDVCLEQIKPGQDGSDYRAGIQGFDRAENLVSNYATLHNLKDMEAKNLMSSRTEVDMWSDWYHHKQNQLEKRLHLHLLQWIQFVRFHYMFQKRQR
jgi:hypothetical protein